MSKKAIIWVLVVILAVGAVAVLAVVDDRNRQARQADARQEILALTPEDHIKGAPPGQGELTIIKYSDFQCPACAAAAAGFAGVSPQVLSRITFVYRHFPLESIHSFAAPAARAAEAAARQGKFWEFHDLLFARQPLWSAATGSAEDIFASYARELGLDEEKFRADYRLPAVAERVSVDAEGAEKLSLRGTPTFFVDGRETNLPRSSKELEKFLIDLLEKKQ